MEKWDFLPSIPKGDATLTLIYKDNSFHHLSRLPLEIIRQTSPRLASAFVPNSRGIGLEFCLQGCSAAAAASLLRYIFSQPRDYVPQACKAAPISLLVHVEVYHLGDLYDIAQLRQQAKDNIIREFQRACSYCAPPIYMCEAIRYVYKVLRAKMDITAILVPCLLHNSVYSKLGHMTDFHEVCAYNEQFQLDLCMEIAKRGYLDSSTLDLIRIPISGGYSRRGRKIYCKVLGDVLYDVWFDYHGERGPVPSLTAPYETVSLVDRSEGDKGPPIPIYFVKSLPSSRTELDHKASTSTAQKTAAAGIIPQTPSLSGTLKAGLMVPAISQPPSVSSTPKTGLTVPAISQPPSVSSTPKTGPMVPAISQPPSVSGTPRTGLMIPIITPSESAPRAPLSMPEWKNTLPPPGILPRFSGTGLPLSEIKSPLPAPGNVPITNSSVTNINKTSQSQPSSRSVPDVPPRKGTPAIPGPEYMDLKLREAQQELERAKARFNFDLRHAVKSEVRQQGMPPCEQPNKSGVGQQMSAPLEQSKSAAIKPHMSDKVQRFTPQQESALLDRAMKLCDRTMPPLEQPNKADIKQQSTPSPTSQANPTPSRSDVSELEKFLDNMAAELKANDAKLQPHTMLIASSREEVVRAIQSQPTESLREEMARTIETKTCASLEEALVRELGAEKSDALQEELVRALEAKPSAVEGRRSAIVKPSRPKVRLVNKYDESGSMIVEMSGSFVNEPLTDPSDDDGDDEDAFVHVCADDEDDEVDEDGWDMV